LSQTTSLPPSPQLIKTLVLITGRHLYLYVSGLMVLRIMVAGSGWHSACQRGKAFDLYTPSSPFKGHQAPCSGSYTCSQPQAVANSAPFSLPRMICNSMTLTPNQDQRQNYFYLATAQAGPERVLFGEIGEHVVLGVVHGLNGTTMATTYTRKPGLPRSLFFLLPRQARTSKNNTCWSTTFYKGQHPSRPLIDKGRR